MDSPKIKLRNEMDPNPKQTVVILSPRKRAKDLDHTPPTTAASGLYHPTQPAVSKPSPSKIRVVILSPRKRAKDLDNTSTSTPASGFYHQALTFRNRSPHISGSTHPAER